jgi:hypothetical protein
MPADDLPVAEFAFPGPLRDQLVAAILAGAKTRVSARNPYWDRWGITIADPDGYRLVLSTLSWP